ncbi:MAG: hypothetical protein ABI480_17150 [Chitinophagaceae bacterium]
MKFFVALILTAMLAFISAFYFDWWIIAVASFVTALLIHQKPWKAFLAGFLGLFLLWGILAEWIDSKNESILSGKISQLLGIGNNPFLLVLITAFIGGLVAGLAALSGSYLRKTK